MSILGLTSLALLLDGAVWLVLFFGLVFVILVAAALALRAIMVPVGGGSQAPSLGRVSTADKARTSRSTPT